MTTPTTDRELLELAAKAACAELTGYRGSEPIYGMPHETSDGTEYIRWNPLNDDGDALRLAVKLRVLVDVNHAAGALVMWHLRSLVEPWGDDPYAAARRAIVRAAAEIGKAMP